VAEAVDDVRRFEAILAKRAPETAVRVVVEDCGLHHEDYWAGRLPAALRFLFPPKA
jgi:hypothetical protein